jgi:OmcA/MtrC family decaheme c-type cytochrome
MSMKLSSIKKFLMVFALIVSVALLASCGGSDGKDGATGPQGPQGPAGPEGPAGPPGQDLTAVAEPESCSICHADVGEKDHQSIYDAYVDASNLAMQITSVKSTADGQGGFNVAMTVSITKDGMPFTDGLASLDQHSFYVQGYDAATRSFPNAMNKSLSYTTATVVSPGVYKLTATGVSYAPENSNAFAYGYIAKDRLDTEIAGHYNLYDNMASAGLSFGNADEYDSYANVEGCQMCHGTPYRKHGYREAVVAGLPTFAACKACHMDDRAGGHPDWQQIVDDPVAWGNGDDASANPQYAYTRRIMNDVHMSHAMEFPYPQSMSNCSTCHEGKMDKVTADEFFVADTCKSCHGVKSRPDEYNALTFYAKRAPSLEDIWVEKNVAFHSIDMNCQGCHGPGTGTFSAIHTGYDPKIYNANGERYADLYTAEITSVSLADGKLDIRFTANTDLMTEPTVLVSFYGYDTKQFIVSSHSRDADRNRLGEYTIGGSSPYFTEEADSVQGNWHVVMDATALPADVGVIDMIESGAIKRLEVSIQPTVEVNGVTVATNGVSKTLVLASNSVDDNYFKGANAVVDVEGCNACHDALATTFHSPDRGGDITLCKHCHVPSSGGSHLEMQSREIAGYVHAIHKFQAFDPEDINFWDPVEANIYNLHIEHVFPNFTIKNCEACHLEGVFNVPDQSASLPAVLSASSQNDAGPNGEDTWNRKIGEVPSYVVGPASKACGGCHRAEIINEDLPGELASFNQHTKAGGYLIENEDGTWQEVVDKIMGMFK